MACNIVASIGSRLFRPGACLLSAIAVFFISHAGAAPDIPETWTLITTDDTATFSTAADWSGSDNPPPPPAGNKARDDTFIFGDVGTGSVITVTLDQGGGNPKTQNAGVLRFTSDADAYTFNEGSNNIFDLYGDGTASNIGIENLSGNVQTFNVPFDVNDNQQWNSGSTDNGGNLVFNDNVSLVSSEKTVTLTGANDFIFNSNLTNGTGNEVNLTIAGPGTVEMGASGVIDGINNIEITTDGTLLLGADGQVVPNDGSATNDLILSGGKLDTAGFDADFNGTLTLTAGSTIDLGKGDSVLTFDTYDLSGSTGVLLITDWTGNIGATGGQDSIVFGSFLDTLGVSFEPNDTTSLIRFDMGGGNFSDALILANGSGLEVVPLVPEPSAVLGACLLLGLAGFWERKRILKLLRRG